MQLRIRHILILVASLMISSEGFAATCTIQSGPPAALADYIRETTKAAQAINQKYSQNICSSSTSPITSLNRSLSTLDKAGNQVPIMNNIVTDFTYNVVSLYRIDMPPIVLTHGQLLYALEKNTIIPTLDTLASRCQLDGEAEKEIIALIQRNNHIQDYFRGVVIWTIGEGTDTLEQAILDNYRKEATMSCTEDTDISTVIEKWSKAIEGFGIDITEAMENWKASMALLRGESTDPKKDYVQLQKELLRKELQRQWLSQWAMQQVMTNLDCMQQESDGIDSIASWTRARANCVGNPLIGYQKLKAAYEELKWWINSLKNGVKKFFGGNPTTTDGFITLTTKIDKTVDEEKDILILFSQMQAATISLWNEESTTNTIITNLINIHTSLVGMNWLLEKRIPKMQNNCMKWSPGVTGWCYQR